VQAAVDYRGQPSAAVLEFAYLNSSFETGYSNPIDDAIRATEAIDLASSRKLDEVPYDFLRKRLGVLVNYRGRKLLIVKGAVKAILEVCTSVTHDGHELPLDEVRAEIQRRFVSFPAPKRSAARTKPDFCSSVSWCSAIPSRRAFKPPSSGCPSLESD
jgi:Mg2+-importing ATPase